MGGMETILSAKVLPFVIAGAFLVPGLALGAQYAYYEDVPTWHVGDAWVYRNNVTLTVHVEAGDQVVTETVQRTVFHTLRVMNDSATFKGLPAYEMAVFKGPRKVDTFYLSKGGLNPIVTKASDIQEGVPKAKRGAEEVPFFNWALTPFKSWSYQGIECGIQFQTGDRDFLSVADTTLSSIRIEPDYSDCIDEGVDNQAVKVDVQELSKQYWYSGAAKFIAQEEYRVRQSVEVKSQTFGGYGMSATTPRVFVSTDVLTKSELVRATALGTEDASFTYVDLGIVMPEAVDVAQGGAASFQAVASDGIPEGAVVQWVIGGERYEGETVDVAFKKPGLKSIYAEVLLNGEPVGAIEELYEVYWTGAFEGTLSATGSAQEHAFTAYEDAVVRATYAATGGLLLSDPDDDVTVYDPDGEAVAEGAVIEFDVDEAGEHVIEVDTDAAEYNDGRYTLAVEMRFPGATKGVTPGSESAAAGALLAALARVAPDLVHGPAGAAVAAALADLAPEGEAAVALASVEDLLRL